MDNIIAFSRKKILQNQGNISHEQAKTFAEKEYSTYNNHRKNAEAQQADKEDQQAIEELVKKTKKKP